LLDVARVLLLDRSLGLLLLLLLLLVLLLLLSLLLVVLLLLGLLLLLLRSVAALLHLHDGRAHTPQLGVEGGAGAGRLAHIAVAGDRADRATVHGRLRVGGHTGGGQLPGDRLVDGVERLLRRGRLLVRAHDGDAERSCVVA